MRNFYQEVHCDTPHMMLVSRDDIRVRVRGGACNSLEEGFSPEKDLEGRSRAGGEEPAVAFAAQAPLCLSPCVTPKMKVSVAGPCITGTHDLPLYNLSTLRLGLLSG